MLNNTICQSMVIHHLEWFFNGLVRLANGFVTEGKQTKHAKFGYPVTKFISSDARHITTVHQTGISVPFVQWKLFNMLKLQTGRNGHRWTKSRFTG